MSVLEKILICVIVIAAFLIGVLIAKVTGAEAGPTGPPFNASYYNDGPPRGGSSSYGGYNGSYYSPSPYAPQAYDYGYRSPEPWVATAIIVGVAAVIAGAILSDNHRGGHRRDYGHNYRSRGGRGGYGGSGRYRR